MNSLIQFKNNKIFNNIFNKKIKFIILLILLYKYKNNFFYYYKHKKFYYRKFKTLLFLIFYKFINIFYGININNKNIKYINFMIYENFYKIPIILNFIKEIDIESITTTDTTHEVNTPQEVDITYTIIPYMGPNHNFYNMNITPNDLGYNNLNFTINNKIYKFNNNDLIKF